MIYYPFVFPFANGFNVYDTEWRYLASVKYGPTPKRQYERTGLRYSFRVHEWGPNGPCFKSRREVIAAIRRILE